MNVGHDAGAGMTTRVVERPPEGLAQGHLSVPAWLVVALGVAVVTVSIAYWLWRFFPRTRR